MDEINETQWASGVKNYPEAHSFDTWCLPLLSSKLSDLPLFSKVFIPKSANFADIVRGEMYV
ncbi:hypothetical protein FACS1894200_02540 [Spirochaetia bacterium]|nr:hypothetical protein FACS1894200_02540 [Spirochaetia bacterium]